MDQKSFDRLARRLSGVQPRRSVLAAVASIGLLGSQRAADAKSRKARRRARRVTAQAADCLSLGPGSNVSRCDYSRTSLRNRDLSGSTMVGAKFNQADLCGANLSSSSLRNAQFNGANLFRANLRSSGCRGVQFNADTILCLTTDCNGNLRNDDCPTDGSQNLICCSDSHCPAGTVCCQRELAPERAVPDPVRFPFGRCRARCIDLE